jgi:hypothetical protein
VADSSIAAHAPSDCGRVRLVMDDARRDTNDLATRGRVGSYRGRRRHGGFRGPPDVRSPRRSVGVTWKAATRSLLKCCEPRDRMALSEPGRPGAQSSGGRGRLGGVVVHLTAPPASRDSCAQEGAGGGPRGETVPEGSRRGGGAFRALPTPVRRTLRLGLARRTSGSCPWARWR